MHRDKCTEDKCHFCLTNVLILRLLEPGRVPRRYEYICLVLMFLGICCGPPKRQNIGIGGQFLWGFLMFKQPDKKKVDSPQNVKSCSSWQQDHQGRCFPNGSLHGPARTRSPYKTAWRIVRCLVLIPNVKESKYQTPPWNRITILHPAALTIHDFAAHRISFHIPLVHCFPNCAKSTTSATETVSEQHACAAQIF